MHPADELEAFNRLATKDKLPPEKIAQRFDVSERYVPPAHAPRSRRSRADEGLPRE
jgi:hypothetical protein